MFVYTTETVLGTDAKFCIEPLSPSNRKLLEVLNVPSTPIKLTEVEPETPVSTTPNAPVVSCLIISPADAVMADPSVSVFFVIAVNICFDVVTGVCGLLVDRCNPSLSNQTTPPELKSPD